MTRRYVDDEGCLIPAVGCSMVLLGYGFLLMLAALPILLLIKWLFF